MRERDLIAEIKKRAGKPGKPVKSGIGDDCAVLEYNKEKYLLWGTDMLVEGTHFNIKKDGCKRIGRKAVAVNVSDIAAMGGVPKYISMTLGIPPGMSQGSIRAVCDGVFDICSEYGIKIIGGDTDRSKKLVIDVSIMGLVEKKRLVERSGAKAGDLVLVTGPVRDGRKTHLTFIPRLEEARFLTKNYKINSMIDVSDGIGPDLGHICEESGTGGVVYSGAVPLSKGLSLEDALYYGESFELLFTMRVGEARKLFIDMKLQKNRRMNYFIIGEIRPKREGLVLVGKEGKVSKLRAEGFRHF
ncbi:MAG: thiamine-phosphate kinase [Candidatus Omnitrophota bacterium]